jgi:hypothetical protein
MSVSHLETARETLPHISSEIRSSSCGQASIYFPEGSAFARAPILGNPTDHANGGVPHVHITSIYHSGISVGGDIRCVDDETALLIPNSAYADGGWPASTEASFSKQVLYRAPLLSSDQTL